MNLGDSHSLLRGFGLARLGVAAVLLAIGPALPEGLLPGTNRGILALTLLVVAGTLAPLVKQTFGVFWIAVLAAHLVPTLLRADAEHRTSVRALGWLAGGALTSALFAWATYAIVLASWAPDVPAWLRPYRNLQHLAQVYDGTDAAFPLWIYIRNLWAYGRVTTLLLIPGLALSLAGSRLQRRVGYAWMTAVVLIHAMPLREVRYLAFVAPLSAFVIAPAVAILGRHKTGSLLVAALLLLDVHGAAMEASRVGTAFYRESPVRTLLEPLVDGDARLTYAGLLERARRVAGGLAGLQSREWCPLRPLGSVHGLRPLRLRGHRGVAAAAPAIGDRGDGRPAGKGPFA